MSLTRFLVDVLKVSPDRKRAALANAAEVARHYGIPERTVTDYLKMMGEK